MKKAIIPVAIIVGCIILGFFYYLAQATKQESIARQQEADRQLEKKRDCLAIYESQRDQFRNVTGWSYNEVLDWCAVEYKNTETGETFSKSF